MQKVFQNVQKKLGRSPIHATFCGILQDQCIDVDIVMESSMKAALNLGKDFVKNSEIHLNTKFENVESVFDITQKLIQEQSGEILIVECLRYSSPSWERWILANDQAIKWAKARVFVYADSVLCLGKTEQGSGAAEKWKGKLEDIKMYSPYQDAVGIDGEAIELEWKIPDFSILSILQEIQKDLIQKNIQPKEPNHLRVNVQRHPVEIRWSELHHKRRECQGLRVAVPSRTLDVSWSRLRHVLTINKDSGISQKIRWYNNSKKQDTLFSWAPVLWSEEFSNEDKTKVPFTSIENPRTRNSCLRRCILQLSSVSTEQRRLGVLSSAWRLKRKDQMQFLWTVKCWLLWSQPEEVEWFTANSSTWIQGAGTHQFSCSGEQSSNDTVVWKGFLPVFGLWCKILPDTTRWKRWRGRNHIRVSKNPKSG